ncbi:MAG: Ku protein [Caulobacteraceae bacterium]
MAARPTWQGHLRLSLVTCPVALYTATNAAGDVHFNLINPKTNNRIRMITTDPDTGPVERSSLVKGYEVEKGQYVTLTDEEIRSVRLDSTKTIDIERFVDVEEIDRLYWNDPYFLVPDGKIAAEAYSVIREAMGQTGQIALGRVVLHTRERLLALEPRDNGIVAYSLRTRDEVRKPSDFFRDIPDVKADPGMVDIARKIIEQQQGAFEPSEFVDHYEAALKALIADKLKGHKPKTVAAPKDTNVVDLMEALRQSLKGGGKAATPAAKSAPSKKKAAHRKAG